MNSLTCQRKAPLRPLTPQTLELEKGLKFRLKFAWSAKHLKETLSEKDLHLAQGPTLATLMPFQELRLPVFMPPPVYFFPTRITPKGRGFLNTVGKTHSRTHTQEIHSFSASGCAR